LGGMDEGGLGEGGYGAGKEGTSIGMCLTLRRTCFGLAVWSGRICVAVWRVRLRS